MSKQKRISLENIEEGISLFMMILMFLAVGTNIVMNWVIGKRFGQLEELGTAAYMFSCYAGFGLLYKRREFTDVTFVVDCMPPRLRWCVDLLVYAYLSFFGAILTYQSFMLCLNSFTKKLAALQIPYIYLDVCLVIGFSILAIRAGRDTIKHLLSSKKYFSKGGQA